MENYLYEQPISPSSSFALPEEPTSSLHHSKERRRGGKRSTGVKLSTDPQSVAARERRHRISDRFKILKSLVPGGNKMDTVSMLEEAIHYVKYLKAQIWLLHQAAMMVPFEPSPPLSFPYATTTTTNNNTVSRRVSDSSLLLPQQTFCNSLPPLPPSLSPFPCGSFLGDEDLFSQLPFNY